MSVRCISQVLEASGHSGTELLMLLVLADYSDDDGNSYPAVASLARKCRMKPRNANYILNALQASGELKVLKNEGPKGTNRYRIMLANLKGNPLQHVAPLQGSAPLQRSAPTPAMECTKPLHPIAPEPSLNRHEPSKKARKRATAFDASLIELPEWLPRESWAAWVADRKERHKPITQRAAGAQVKALERYLAEGYQPADVIDHSIAGSFQGLYPPKSISSGRNVRPSIGLPVLDAEEQFIGGRV